MTEERNHMSVIKSTDSSDSSLEFESSFFQYKDSRMRTGDESMNTSVQVSRIEKVEELCLSSILVPDLKDMRSSEASVRYSKVDMV